MRTIGIIGGTGPESTIEYYVRIIAAYRAADPRKRYPSILSTLLTHLPSSI